MNRIDEKSINTQVRSHEHIDDLFRIIKKSIEELDCDMALSILAVRCFNYGIMIGKRQEREKHKKCVVR